jgi:hypothetical protein
MHAGGARVLDKNNSISTDEHHISDTGDASRLGQDAHIESTSAPDDSGRLMHVSRARPLNGDSTKDVQQSEMQLAETASLNASGHKRLRSKSLDNALTQQHAEEASVASVASAAAASSASAAPSAAASAPADMSNTIPAVGEHRHGFKSVSWQPGRSKYGCVYPSEHRWAVSCGVGQKYRFDAMEDAEEFAELVFAMRKTDPLCKIRTGYPLSPEDYEKHVAALQLVSRKRPPKAQTSGSSAETAAEGAEEGEDIGGDGGEEDEGKTDASAIRAAARQIRTASRARRALELEKQVAAASENSTERSVCSSSSASAASAAASSTATNPRSLAVAQPPTPDLLPPPTLQPLSGNPQMWSAPFGFSFPSGAASFSFPSSAPFMFPFMPASAGMQPFALPVLNFGFPGGIIIGQPSNPWPMAAPLTFNAASFQSPLPSSLQPPPPPLNAPATSQNALSGSPSTHE